MKRSQVIAGIDIGTSKTATVITTVDENEMLSIIGVAQSESRGVRKGQIVDIEDATSTVVKSLEAAERMAGYQVQSAFISVGGTHISSQNSHGVVAVAEPSKEISEHDVARVIEAAKAISLASARQIIHVLPRYYTVDSQEGIKDPVGMSGVRLEVDTHLVTGAMISLKNIEKCVNNVGIDSDGFVFNGLASAESVLTETEKELGVVLLDVGAGTTDIAVYVEGALSYSSVLPIGARNVTGDLAIGLRISLESAEKLKLFLSKQKKMVTRPAVTIDKKSDKKHRQSQDLEEIDVSSLNLPEGIRTVSKKTIVEGIIRPRLNELFSLISAEIKKSGFAGVVPSGIVLTGGGAQTVGIQEAARRTVALPFRIGMPHDVRGVTDEVLAPSYATAIGLVKYGMQMEPKEAGSMMKFSSFLSGSPIKGTASKLIDLAKSLLP
ncbi:cell division protein FtsA [Candidatus Roizmanbacteria bacterium]|nr:cell division protein FtsA [Candidatus Roizmanbacteria bacterium]